MKCHVCSIWLNGALFGLEAGDVGSDANGIAAVCLPAPQARLALLLELI